jgi:hypothetical protein
MKKQIYGLFLAISIGATTTIVAQSANDGAVQLPYGVPQVLELTKAKISDSTILSYIQNSRTAYNLEASQIIYLKQQGVSDVVINAMLNQRNNVTAQNTVASTSTANNSNYNYTQSSATVVQPATTTYVQTIPASTVYVIPDTRAYYYASYRPYYVYPRFYAPAVSVSFGFHNFCGIGFRGCWY